MTIHRLIVLATLGLAGCASVITNDYHGADAGHVVIGIGATKGTLYDNYAFQFHRTDAPAAADGSSASGRLIYFQANLFYSRKPDYDNKAEAGVIITADLPPGRYEIFDVSTFQNLGTSQTTYHSPRPISIPFVVQAGKSVYLGNYQANGLFGKNILGMSMYAGAVFVVEDRLAQDVGLARMHPQAGVLPAEVLDATPDMASIRSPLFISRDKMDSAKSSRMPSSAASSNN